MIIVSRFPVFNLALAGSFFQVRFWCGALANEMRVRPLSAGVAHKTARGSSVEFLDYSSNIITPVLHAKCFLPLSFTTTSIFRKNNQPFSNCHYFMISQEVFFYFEGNYHSMNLYCTLIRSKLRVCVCFQQAPFPAFHPTC